ncbi:lipase member H [Nothobranchius furzeri]|uniref:Lipase member H-like n=1 Tax=Nothobranchius furzeri TaxID=105023 RepID=A0A1A7ZXX8_NOTFU|nr:lipase member H [Nothobranchius furzeri]KAF7205761.1 lipase member H-like [Nothobranchius furzeri]
MFLWQYLTPFLLTTLYLCKAHLVGRCDKFTDLNLAHAFLGTSVRVRLLLYTRHNHTCGTLISHTNLTQHPQFNLSHTTTFIIHGYRPTGSPPTWLLDITERLLVREDMNVVLVDWNRGAATLNYLKAVENTRKVADNITAFIQKMQDGGASLSSVHLIGVSLGAHISGFVGATFNGSIGRITGLDAAGPEFSYKPLEERLDPTDAQFVDVLHTDIDALGYKEPLGHIDFYANGGKDQPGCPKTIFSGGEYFKCDHQRSVILFIDTITGINSARAYPCSSYNDFLDGKCLNCDSFGDAGCPLFGYDVIQWKDILLKQKQAKYYFTTNDKSPFFKSNYLVDVMIWSRSSRWGYLTVKLNNGTKEAVAVIDHKDVEFRKHTETKLFAQFDKDIESVKEVSLTFSTGKLLKHMQKLRVLKIRVTNLEHKEKPLCRYDFILEKNHEVTFKLLLCEESLF